jgi:hypothetical protein
VRNVAARENARNTENQHDDGDADERPHNSPNDPGFSSLAHGQVPPLCLFRPIGDYDRDQFP